ncbi:hypothetical protein BOTNAR_0639g00010 [Botryotinia narcissicola]|uniref:Uncharacterized protein n=1 Tax=Botryotinia narcissicola TaxID=278944 RepID=A0A4Z1HAE1_9HELO|nr:hypothetical protein BOTNAR_0639g00010 [Botryotinia narcissicola]
MHSAHASICGIAIENLTSGRTVQGPLSQEVVGLGDTSVKKSANLRHPSFGLQNVIKREIEKLRKTWLTNYLRWKLQQGYISPGRRDDAYPDSNPMSMQLPASSKEEHFGFSLPNFIKLDDKN